MSERVTSEPRTYALDSPHSFFFDVMRASTDPGRSIFRDSHERLDQYGRELVSEMDAGTPEGRRASNVLREASRVGSPVEHETTYRDRLRELRALTTGGGVTASAGGGGGAALVSPYFLLDSWAPYRGLHRTFADQCHSLPMPAWGMEVYLPAFTSDMSAAQQTEGAGVSSTDPSTGLPGGQVVTIAGKAVPTQQFYDRAMTGGGGADEVLAAQLNQDLDTQIDVYAVTNAISGGGSFAGTAAWTIASFYQDCATGREGLSDTAGARLRATHVFTTEDQYGYATRQVDATTNRPILTPQFAPGFPLVDSPDQANVRAKWSRFTGTVLPASVLWFTDDNIPASGSNTQVIVAAPDAALILLESSEPYVAVSEQTLAGNLEVVFVVYKYVTIISRHSKGVQTFSGAGYPTSNK